MIKGIGYKMNKYNNKIIEEELINKGFIEYPKSPLHSESVTNCYQKRYRDDKGTKYFIDVCYYKLIHPTTKEDLSGYEISGQFYLKDNHNAVNMDFLDSTITEVEQFIDKLFELDILECYE